MFSRDKIITQRNYIVEGLIAEGTCNTIISKSGVGKTFFAFDLAVCLVLGKSFLGLKTKQCSVLVVDQDQPTDDSYIRLSQFLNYHKVTEHENLTVSFNENNLQLADGTLLYEINLINPDVVIIDSISSVSEGLDLNNPSHSLKFKSLHKNCLNKNITVIFLHHISEKIGFTYNDFLTADAGSLSMYSSVFVQAIDGFFVLYNPHKGKDLSQLCVRSIMKRYKIEHKLFETSMEQTDHSLHFTKLVDKDIEDERPLSKEEKIILNILGDKSNTINKIYEEAGGRIGRDKTYEWVEGLKVKGMVDVKNAGQQKNQYFLTSLGEETIKELKEKGED